VWNATNITLQMRDQLVGLAAPYHPAITMVYVEVPYKKLLAQNKGREHPIPELAVEKYDRQTGSTKTLRCGMWWWMGKRRIQQKVGCNTWSFAFGNYFFWVLISFLRVFQLTSETGSCSTFFSPPTPILFANWV